MSRVLASGPAAAPALFLEADTLLCRFWGRLLPTPSGRAPIGALAARALHALHRARLSRGVARQATLVAEAAGLLGECLGTLQTGSPEKAEEKGLVECAASALRTLHALRTELEQVLFATGSVGAPLGAPDVAPLPTEEDHGLKWSSHTAMFHDLPREPILLPLPPDAGDEPESAADGEADDEPDENAPPMSLDELRALANSLGAERDDVARDEDGRETSLLVPEPARALPAPDERMNEFVPELLTAHLEAVAALFGAWREAQCTDGTWDVIERLERGMRDHADAIAWLGSQAVEPLFRALLLAEAPGPAFAAAFPLLCINGFDTADAVLLLLDSDPGGRKEGLVEAMRLSPHPEVQARLPLLLAPDASPSARLAAVRALGDRGALDDPTLDRLLSDPDADVVAAAVEHILCTGKTYALPRLEYMTERVVAEPAAQTVLATAAVLGSGRARGKLRSRLWQTLQQGEPVPTRLVDALAACGDESDVDLLTSLAVVSLEDPLDAVLRALGWLGSARALPLLREFAQDVEAAANSLRLLLGEEAAADPRATLGQGRWMRGKPWTASIPAAMFADPDTPSDLRELAFLDLVARTGLHVPFDRTWPAARQRQAAPAFLAAAERVVGKLPAATWLYQGAPSAPERSS